MLERSCLPRPLQKGLYSESSVCLRDLRVYRKANAFGFDDDVFLMTFPLGRPKYRELLKHGSIHHVLDW